MTAIITKSCESCPTAITGAPHLRFCRPCRNRRYRRTTRYLSPGEQVPPGEPGRYPASHGYIRLRWRVGRCQYVETYEHRVFDGAVTTADEVHHDDRDRSNNRPGNLLPLSTAEHRAAHAPGWWPEAGRLYASGLSTYKIGKQLGRNPATVYRVLVKLDVPLRKEARVAIPWRERNAR